MATTNYPNGVSSYGVPVMGGSNIPGLTGNYWFVDSASTLGAGDGSSAFPMLTLAAAVSAATANNGDVIVLQPGHAQTIIGAAGATITKAGLTIVGLGNGTNAPTFTFTTSTAASFDITAANTTISGCIFTCGIDAQSAMINVTGADVSILNNTFNQNSATVGAVVAILTAATATRINISSNRFVGPAVNSGTTTTASIKHESGVDYQISNNYFTGKMTQAIVNVATILRGIIDNNRFVIATGTA